MPGVIANRLAEPIPAQRAPIEIKGLTAGVGYDLATCCHPVPGDRIIGVRRGAAGSKCTRSVAARSRRSTRTTGST